MSDGMTEWQDDLIRAKVARWDDALQEAMQRWNCTRDELRLIIDRRAKTFKVIRVAAGEPRT